MDISKIDALYAIPILYTVISLALIFIKDIDKKKLRTIKRLYYSAWLFITVWLINSIDLEKIKASNTFGLPQPVWVIFSIFITGIAVSVILNMLIISDTNIKEINFGGAKIVKEEEIKTTMEEQVVNVKKLEDKIESEFDIIQNFETYILSNAIENKILNNFAAFDWEKEFTALAQHYCDLQGTSIRVYCLKTNSLTLEADIKSRFFVTNKDFKLIKSRMQKDKSIQISNQKELLFIPYKPLYYNEEIIIILSSEKYIFEIEQAFILNIFKIFESYTTDIIARLPQPTQQIP